jgi:hypothetical protein
VELVIRVFRDLAAVPWRKVSKEQLATKVSPEKVIRAYKVLLGPLRSKVSKVDRVHKVYQALAAKVYKV